MIKFNPDDPYPLLPPGSYTYLESQEHARQVDAWLGLATEAIEQKISKRLNPSDFQADQQLWIDLPVETLQTPYVEIREILSLLPLREGSKLIDLGCGYGRLGVVLARHYPEVHFLGYEFVEERVAKAGELLAQIGANRARIEKADLSDRNFSPEKGDIYFLYDYGSRSAIAKTLEDLRMIAQSEPIIVVGRGRASRDAIELNQPWLSQVVKPKHFPHYSIYFSSEQK